MKELPTEIEITSHRQGIGKLIVAYKKLVQKLIGPYLRNVFEKEHQMLEERFREMHGSFNARIAADEAVAREIMKRVEGVTVALSDRLEEFSASRDDINGRYQGVHNKIETLRLRFEDLAGRASPPSLESAKERLSNYLPLFEGSEDVVEIGCSAFAEALKKCGIRAISLDSDAAGQYFSKIAEGSVGGLFMGAGSLPHDAALFKKLKTGAVAVIEGANIPFVPGSIHPELIRRLVESSGFEIQDVWFIGRNGSKVSLAGAGQADPASLNSMISSCPYYAIIAKRR